MLWRGSEGGPKGSWELIFFQGSAVASEEKMSGKMGPLLALAGLVLISNLGKDELAKQGVKNTCASKLQEKIHCKAICYILAVNIWLGTHHYKLLLG